MKSATKAFFVSFFVTALISCAFPATAQDYCYAGVSGGVSYASDQYINKMENRIYEIVNTTDIKLKFKEKKFGSPYEMFAGCRKGAFAIELGKIENITASVRTTATFKIAGQTFSGDVNRLAEVSGWSLSLLAYQRIGLNLEGYARVGLVQGYGIIKATLPLPHEYDGGMIAYEKRKLLPRIGLGLQGRIGERTDWRAEIGAIGTPKVPIGMFALSQHF
jgi:hypothetical protein